MMVSGSMVARAVMAKKSMLQVKSIQANLGVARDMGKVDLN